MFKLVRRGNLFERYPWMLFLFNNHPCQESNSKSAAGSGGMQYSTNTLFLYLSTFLTSMNNNAYFLLFFHYISQQLSFLSTPFKYNFFATWMPKQHQNNVGNIQWRPRNF